MSFPCSLNREDALIGHEMATRLELDDNNINVHTNLMPAGSGSGDGDCASIAGSNVDPDVDIDSTTGSPCEDEGDITTEDTGNRKGKWKGKGIIQGEKAGTMLSRFEFIFTTHPPILESLLSQLPTHSLFDLVHTSHHLRDFLTHYPLAWRTLSFRLPQPALLTQSPGVETPDGNNRHAKQNFLNVFLRHIVLPNASLLTNLDLCNTSVDGMTLCSNVWYPRIGTLKHLSVRGCKNVSIKYHIVPFLQNFSPRYSPWVKDELALKSLYTYRCRHHRRRPYLPSSLMRRDSDSEPTHELIELCHMMGIWTDTAWCPTPGGRCYRRKDYHGNRAAPGTHEVWVPFDRLWRSQNRIGLPDRDAKYDPNDGRVWECGEEGWDGEPLTGAGSSFTGESKELPAHMRHSHRLFVENIKCDACGESVAERCETCSVRMHCMGCRKTLCASCAFTRPLPRRRPRIRSFQALLNGSLSGSPQRTTSERRGNEYWWAPGAGRSPNLMNEASEDSDSETEENGNAGPAQQPAVTDQHLKLNMHWCCLEPMFSGGGGIAFLGPGLAGRGAEKVRAAPLPNNKRWKDRDFMPSTLSQTLSNPQKVGKLKNHALYESVVGEDLDILPYLRQESIELQTQTCPRSLCQDCHRTFRWKISCRGCKKAICKEHDFRGLKVRKCGYRDLSIEREWLRTRRSSGTLRIPAYRPPNPSPAASPRPTTRDFADDEPSTSKSPPLSRDVSQSSANSLSGTMEPLDLSSSGRLSPKRSSFTPIPPASPPRHRSLSFSGLRPKPSATSFAASPIYPPVERTPLPGSPRHPVQWEGCGEFFCQTLRPAGDSRPHCTSGMKMCTDCGVWVCPVCLHLLRLSLPC